MGHVMSATKPKTKDANTKQTKGPHWPRLEWGLFIVFVELIGLELSSITPKKQIIRSFLKIWEGKSSPCCHRACTCAQFSESLALGERLTPFPWVFLPVSFKTAKNKQTNPSSEGKLRKAQWMWIFPFEVWGQCGPPESLLRRLNQRFRRREGAGSSSSRKGWAGMEAPACLPCSPSANTSRTHKDALSG